MNDNTVLREAQTLLQKENGVILSCPQKICVSGDYGDMHDGGLTLSAGINVRPSLTLRYRSVGRPVVSIRCSTRQLGKNRWPLVRTFEKRLAHVGVPLEVEVLPTNLTDVGLGSSGSGALLLAAALALAENRAPGLRELIEQAHNLETEQARCPCGMQDHAVAALGGFRLIEYPTLAHRPIPFDPHWSLMSFWIGSERRHARDVIPWVVRGHDAATWKLREQLTLQMARGFERGDPCSIRGALEREFELQKRLNMLTGEHLRAAETAVECGAVVKASGAGGGGVVLVFSPNADVMTAVERRFAGLGLSRLKLAVDQRGLSAEPLPRSVGAVSSSWSGAVATKSRGT